MLGIIIGVSAVIAMISIGLGARSQVEQEISKLGTNLLMVLPNKRSTDGLNSTDTGNHKLSESDAIALGYEVADLSHSVPVVRGKLRAVLGNKNWRTSIIGSLPNYLSARDWAVQNGRNFSKAEMISSAKVAIIGKTVIDKISPYKSPLGKIIRLQGIPFRVIGILEEKGFTSSGRDQDDLIIMPLSTAKTRLVGGFYQENREAVQYILLKGLSNSHLDAVRHQAERILRHRHSISSEGENDFTIRDPLAALTAQRAASDTLTVLLASVAAVSLLVGGISIMNIMLVSVAERSQEIGIRIAVGAQRSDILNQFLMEASVVAFVGGLTGTILGIITAYTIQTATGWQIEISSLAIIASLLLSTIVGLVSGVYPAVQASRLNPIEALRRE